MSSDNLRKSRIKNGTLPAALFFVTIGALSVASPTFAQDGKVNGVQADAEPAIGLNELLDRIEQRKRMMGNSDKRVEWPRIGSDKDAWDRLVLPPFGTGTERQLPPRFELPKSFLTPRTPLDNSGLWGADALPLGKTGLETSPFNKPLTGLDTSRFGKPLTDWETSPYRFPPNTSPHSTYGTLQFPPPEKEKDKTTFKTVSDFVTTWWKGLLVGAIIVIWANRKN